MIFPFYMRVTFSNMQLAVLMILGLLPVLPHLPVLAVPSSVEHLSLTLKGPDVAIAALLGKGWRRF